MNTEDIEETVTITLKKYQSLLKDSELLSEILGEFDVDNRQGWDDLWVQVTKELRRREGEGED